MGVGRFFTRLRLRYYRLPILWRLMLGNSAVIVVGAIGGTLITSEIHRLRAASDVWLISVFASAGILLSLVVNFWIVKTTLRPLQELRQTVDRVQSAQPGTVGPLVVDADPDLSRLAAAIESMLERVETRTSQLRALSERVINAQEEERRRIARGLHDEIGQTLSMLMITLERMEAQLPPGTADLGQQLAAACQMAGRTLDDLRKVVYGLRPTMLDDLGLAAAIRWYARSSLEQAGVRVNFGTFDEGMRLEARLEITLFRIAQEAINNIVHHAQARSVFIELERQNRQVCLRLEDDGRGFDVAQTNDQALRLRRFGLLGIRERADLVGGRVDVVSAPGTGTCLEVSVPLRELGEMAVAAAG